MAPGLLSSCQRRLAAGWLPASWTCRLPPPLLLLPVELVPLLLMPVESVAPLPLLLLPVESAPLLLLLLPVKSISCRPGPGGCGSSAAEKHATHSGWVSHAPAECTSGRRCTAGVHQQSQCPSSSNCPCQASHSLVFSL